VAMDISEANDFLNFGSTDSIPINGPSTTTGQKQIIRRSWKSDFVVHFAKFGIFVVVIRLSPYMLYLVSRILQFFIP